MNQHATVDQPLVIDVDNEVVVALDLQPANLFSRYQLVTVFGAQGVAFARWQVELLEKMQSNLLPGLRQSLQCCNPFRAPRHDIINVPRD
ncbi:MAG: hypothetical protein A2341_00185 [Deltaproteobacteria bacterium RIFOXYB12_FULL_58_9]|nr:MAG: hypothetical protein A2341_00185 [Deltaproteobacteria bacterium RIFOXYB12_FULL_58_9]